MIFWYWLVLLVSGIEASMLTRSIFKTLGKFDDFDDLLNGTAFNLKSLLSFSVDDFVPFEAGVISLPRYPSKFLLTSLLHEVNKNEYGFDMVAYSTKLLSNPSNITSLMTEVSRKGFQGCISTFL